MKTLFLFWSFLFSSITFAYDCSTVIPFNPSGHQAAKITVSKFKWDQGIPSYEDVCSKSVMINWFDVRGREEEAYYCLKPNISEVVNCNTTLGDDAAEVDVLPASWVRISGSSTLREYRFHAYVIKEKDPQFYYDIFSRSLLSDLSTQNVIVEG